MQALLILAATAAREARSTSAGPTPRSRGADRGGRARGYRVWLRHSLDLLALALGKLDDAAHDLEPAARGLDELGIHSRVFIPRAELVEVYARAGRSAEAEGAHAAMGTSLECQSPVGLAGGARGRGLLAGDDRFEGSSQSLRRARRSDDRWALARTRLCFGERLRRPRGASTRASSSSSHWRPSRRWEGRPGRTGARGAAGDR